MKWRNFRFGVTTLAASELDLATARFFLENRLNALFLTAGEILKGFCTGTNLAGGEFFSPAAIFQKAELADGVFMKIVALSLSFP